MQSYALSNNQRIFSKTITKGTQEKYFSNGYFYKVDTTLNEGLSEYLTTLLLQHTTLSSDSYVVYEPCLINGKIGCRSQSFLDNTCEEFVTINSLYIKATGNTNLADHLMSLTTADARLKYLLDLVAVFNISQSEFRQYLNILVQLDMLILNTDRHVHNYGVIYNYLTDVYRIAPIFDNGQSMVFDPDNIPISCTLSGSFEAQVAAFGHPIKPCFYIDYFIFNQYLAHIASSYKLNTLITNIHKYKNIFDIKNKQTSFFTD